MSNSIVSPHFNLAETSAQGSFGVVFLKSKAPVFALAVEAAKCGTQFREFQISPQTTAFFAGFGDSEEQVRRLLMTMDWVGTWKGTQAFIKGRPVHWDSRVRDTLHCYLKSFVHPEPAHYCVTTQAKGGFSVSVIKLDIDLPGHMRVAPEPPPKKQALVLPCRRLSPWRWHPVPQGPSVFDQMLGDAIDQEFAWCPRFNPALFGEIEID